MEFANVCVGGLVCSSRMAGVCLWRFGSGLSFCRLSLGRLRSLALRGLRCMRCVRDVGVVGMRLIMSGWYIG